MTESRPVLSDFERGVIVGVLVGEGSFGGDGKQPQVSLRLNVRHQQLLEWLTERVGGSRLYGPYNHGGRVYFQWMARGRALVAELLPLLREAAALDGHAATRLAEMEQNYAGYIAREQRRIAEGL